MRGYDAVRAIHEVRRPEHLFVKWWRRENDFLDYDLVDRFIDNSRYGEELGGVELLTMGQMWDEVRRVGGGRVSMRHEADGDLIQWTHMVGDTMRTDLCPCTATALMAIFDAETRGNPVGH
jgi:hypothetical protein